MIFGQRSTIIYIEQLDTIQHQTGGTDKAIMFIRGRLIGEEFARHDDDTLQ
jgi:hypothetical protein